MAKTAKSSYSIRAVKREYWLPHQEQFDLFYNSFWLQVLVAVLIGANFLTNMVEKEIDPAGEKYGKVFDAFELFYNIVFTIELIINMYAHWFRLFWASGWNIFDFVVVSIGVITTMQIELPSGFSLLRMMRAFRVFRLFRRVRSLNKIIVAIAHAVPGMTNAFLILAIVMSIYTMLAVEFYHFIGEDCLQLNSSDAWLTTARMFCEGDEYFLKFSRCWYTFFQVMTGESWSEAVARPAMWAFYDDPVRALGGGIFFVSYFLVTAFVLTQVVVAVLLDKMVDPDVDEKAKGEDAIEEEEEPEEPTASNGAELLIESQEDLYRAIDDLERDIDELIENSDVMNAEIDIFTREMSSLRSEFTRIAESSVCQGGRSGKSPLVAGQESI